MVHERQEMIANSPSYKSCTCGNKRSMGLLNNLKRGGGGGGAKVQLKLRS